MRLREPTPGVQPEGIETVPDLGDEIIAAVAAFVRTPRMGTGAQGVGGSVAWRRAALEEGVCRELGSAATSS
jgi:hypothetical protein